MPGARPSSAAEAQPKAPFLFLLQLLLMSLGLRGSQLPQGSRISPGKSVLKEAEVSSNCSSLKRGQRLIPAACFVLAMRACLCELWMFSSAHIEEKRGLCVSTAQSTDSGDVMQAFHPQLQDLR